MALQDADQFGAFLQTTQIWDVSEIEKVDVTSDDFKKLIVNLHQQINNIVNVLNIKDTGKYVLSEFVNGQTFFSNPALSSATDQVAEDRQVLRKVINFGALPNAGAKSVAHGITCTPMTTFTRIYGCASDTTAKNYIPIPYTSNAAATDQVQIDIDGTNVIINTGTINRSNFNIVYVVLEYLQN